MIGLPKKFDDVSQYVQLKHKNFSFKGDVGEFIKKQGDSCRELNFFNSKTQDWRYFPLQKLKKAGYILPEKTSLFSKKVSSDSLFYSDAIVLNIKDLPFSSKKEGISVLSWNDILQEKQSLDPHIKEKIFQSLKKKKENLCYLNNVLAFNGFILIIEKSLEKPIEIQYSFENLKEKHQIENLRSFIFVNKGCKAQVTEIFCGSKTEKKDKENSLFFNLQTDCFIEEKGRLEYIRLDQGQSKDVQFNHLFCDLEKQAQGSFFTLNLNSGISRYSTSVLQKQESSCEVKGLSFLKEKKHSSHKVIVRHLEEKGFSRQYYQSILLDSAQHIFNGVIQIDKKAQKVDSHQLNKNLILGDKAFSVSSPKLSIEADDVKACHGSTTSSLNENKALLFYLKSRGLDSFEALHLLLSSFMREPFSSLNTDTQKLIENLLFNHLSKTSFQELYNE